MAQAARKSFEVLLVEDDEGDIVLAKKAMCTGHPPSRVHVARDGAEAIQFLRREAGFENAPRPDLILLDLNMPRMSGRETLEIIKKDGTLRTIPVVVMTTSDADRDVCSVYNLHGSCYVTKPADFKQYLEVVRSVRHFWCNVARVPANA